MLVKICLTANK